MKKIAPLFLVLALGLGSLASGIHALSHQWRADSSLLTQGDSVTGLISRDEGCFFCRAASEHRVAALIGQVMRIPHFPAALPSVSGARGFQAVTALGRHSRAPPC